MNKNIKLAFSIILTLILLFFLFRNIEFSNIDFSIINLSILLAPLALFFFIKIINTFRYARIYGLKPDKKLFLFMCYSNMMLSIIPFRLGELSYIHGLKKYFKKDYGESTEKLILVRFVDYIVVYLLMLVSSIYVSTQVTQGVVKIISIFFIFSLILSLGIIYALSFNSFNIKNKKLSKVASTIKKGSQNILKVSKKEALILFGFTFLYWLIRLLMGFIILLLLGIDLQFFLVVFVSLVLLLVGLLPIQTFMNFGIFEGGWAYFLVNVGLESSFVLPIILLYHFILVLIPIFYGLIGYFILKFGFKR
jgi:uncharacterized membrane protein YbhN (UPF0104 family)